ncbi:hypothetical protein [Nocardia cyriacigeorgica]|uniref:hypothetical protein n=1 Tax=Nocardia cyriacigeorgica TaxID=135487 RepID=UPI002458A284|nr:hypothetical protein [Nocardia cyriacigeorgica]
MTDNTPPRSRSPSCAPWCDNESAIVPGERPGERNHICLGTSAVVELTATPGSVQDDGVILSTVLVTPRQDFACQPVVSLVWTGPWRVQASEVTQLLTAEEARKLADALIAAADTIQPEPRQ